MIFIQGTKRKLDNLNVLLQRYGEIVGPIVNTNKSILFAGSVSASRMQLNMQKFPMLHDKLDKVCFPSALMVWIDLEAVYPPLNIPSAP